MDKDLKNQLWNLDITIAEFVHPLLIAFKESTNGFPYGLTEEEWDSRLDKMIKAFDLIIQQKQMTSDDIVMSEIQEGLDLFAKHYTSLWI